MHVVKVRHNVEAAHRLFSQGPEGGKCWGLHGHSFWIEVFIEAGSLDARGMAVEYGELKRGVRRFLDDQWDHGCLLHENDPLVPVLRESGAKVATLPQDPTVEYLAVAVADKVSELLPFVEHGALCVVRRVTVQETFVNGAEYVTRAPEPYMGGQMFDSDRQRPAYYPISRGDS